MKKELALVSLGLIVISLMLIGPGSAKIDPATAVGVWLFDEDGGKEAVDSSGKGNDGELLGKVKFVPGNLGNGVEFDADALTAVDVSNNEKSLTALDAMTFMAWIKMTGSKGKDRVVVVGASDGAYGGRINSGDSFHCWVRADGAWRYIAPAVAVPDLYDNWHHVASSYDSNTRIHTNYLDGEKKGSGVLAGVANFKIQPGNGSFQIGNRVGWSNGAGQCFDGMMDDVGVFDVALADDDIRTIYDQGLGRALGLIVGPVSPGGKLATAWSSIRE